MGDTYQIGDTIKPVGKKGDYRIVRLVNSVSLFSSDNPDTPEYLKIEKYFELKGGDGDIDFLQLSEEKVEYTGASSIIRALSPIGGRND